MTVNGCPLTLISKQNAKSSLPLKNSYFLWERATIATLLVKSQKLSSRAVFLAKYAESTEEAIETVIKLVPLDRQID